MRVSVIIVSYNTKELTVEAVRCVQDSLLVNSDLQNQIELLIVDNNSSDGSYEELKKLEHTAKIPITVLRNKKNTGFTHANNQALFRSRGEVILLLNSDTRIHVGAIEKLYNTLVAQASNRLGILAASLQNPDGSKQAQGGASPNLWTLMNHLLLLDDIPLLGKLLPSTQHTGRHTLTESKTLFLQGWVAGTAMAIKKEVIDEIGFLDENIFMYGEDIEFCLRAKHHHWTTAIEPQAKVVHMQAASSNKEAAILGELKGYIYIWAKHMPLWQRPLLLSIIHLGILLRWWLFATIGRTEQAQLYRNLSSKV